MAVKWAFAIIVIGVTAGVGQKTVAGYADPSVVCARQGSLSPFSDARYEVRQGQSAPSTGTGLSGRQRLRRNERYCLSNTATPTGFPSGLE